MEAIEELGSRVKVTRIAGTSAGCLVGCLYAAGLSMKELRTRLKGELGQRLLKAFPKPGLPKLAFKALRGSPVWDTTPAEEALEELLAPTGVRTFRDLKDRRGIEVIPTVANLQTRLRHSYTPDADVISTIIDSCGLPFLFKTWVKGNNQTVLVDGGICENLPVDDLLSHERTDGPILALAFNAKRTSSPSSLFSFALALLDTAMSNAVSRARSSLPASSILELPTDIDTFDFRAGLGEGLNAAYDLQKLTVKDRIERFIGADLQDVESVRNDPWVSKDPAAIRVMESAWLLHQTLHAKMTFCYHRCVYVIRANSLQVAGRPGAGQPDVVEYRLKFSPHKEPISCISMSLDSEGATYLARRQAMIKDANGERVKTVELPARNPDIPVDRELLLFCTPPLAVGSGPYEFVIQDESLGVFDGQKDGIGIQPRRSAIPIERIDLVIHLPTGYHASLETMEGSAPGRAMTQQEIDRDYVAPLGFYTLGWTGTNIRSTGNEIFGVDIVRILKG